MAEELDIWLKSGPWGVDVEESPSGWHKHFGSFTILGEGECIKTVFTITLPAIQGRTALTSTNGKSGEANRRLPSRALDAAVHVLPRPPLVILP